MKKTLKLSLFGVPGAGKGTQAGLLTSYLGVPHISTGDMFRALEKGQSDLAKRIKEILVSGELVPDALVTEMTLERLDATDCRNGFLLDGFPRTIHQARSLQDSKHAVDFLIEIKVERNEIIRRLSGRRVCPICQTVYHVDFLKEEVCKLGHGSLLQRDDDKPQSIGTRLDVFESNLAPVVSFYREKGLLRSIEGEGDPKVVFKRILDSIGGSEIIS